MRKYIKNIKNMSAIMGIMFIMLGGCMADNENLLPTLLFVGLGSLFVFIYTRIEKAQEEENKSELN